MKHILFVEDDDLIARVYTQKLSEAGFEVSRAEDGLVAIKRLMASVPDLVILDLLMPKLSGVDVLRFMRRNASLKATRVVIFSNNFLSGLIEQVGTTGVERVIIKSSAKPGELVSVVREVFAAPIHPYRDPPTPARELASEEKLPQPAWRPTGIPPPPPPFARTAPVRELESPADFRARMRLEFAKTGAVAVTGLRELFNQFLEAAEMAKQVARLEDVHRKVRFLTQMAAAAEFEGIARLSGALEALVFELQEKTEFINDSTRQTIASTVELLTQLFHRREEGGEPLRIEQPKVLVVDDDAVSNRALVLALSRMQLRAVSVTNPEEALNQLREQPFNVILLDIELPGMDGLTLCEKLRELPGHRLTPVIFVTSHDDFQTRARSMLIGGNDFISKPVRPVELGVKAVTHLLAALAPPAGPAAANTPGAQSP